MRLCMNVGQIDKCKKLQSQFDNSSISHIKRSSKPNWKFTTRLIVIIFGHFGAFYFRLLSFAISALELFSAEASAESKRWLTAESLFKSDQNKVIRITPCQPKLTVLSTKWPMLEHFVLLQNFELQKIPLQNTTARY